MVKNNSIKKRMAIEHIIILCVFSISFYMSINSVIDDDIILYTLSTMVCFLCFTCAHFLGGLHEKEYRTFLNKQKIKWKDFR